MIDVDDEPTIGETINTANYPSCRKNARLGCTAYPLTGTHGIIHAIFAEREHIWVLFPSLLTDVVPVSLQRLCTSFLPPGVDSIGQGRGQEFTNII